jgi:hypothetical protein
MRRRTAEVVAEEKAHEEARTSMSAFLGPEKKPRRRTGKSMAGMRRAMDGASEHVELGDWSTATPATIVGLYAVLHEKVYGVEPEELAEAWLGAVSAAKRLLEESPFNGDVARLVDFVRFTWKREKMAEDKARGTGNVRRRVGWRLQFVSRALVVDYKRAIVTTTRKR